MTSKQAKEDIEALFTEQAEYIPERDLLRWSDEHPNEREILRKLIGVGAKLLVGPRGCGKTTLLLKAFFSLLYDQSSEVLPVYVNFKSSLKLEPLYKTNPNARFWFNRWLLVKIHLALIETLREMSNRGHADIPTSELALQERTLRTFLTAMELGRLEELSAGHENDIDLGIIEAEFATALTTAGRRRVVLLMDDAAHAFSVEQQRDFFEFFRQVKSQVINPKAAIYPGVTTYASTFHVGHDAEEVDVWLKPASDRYLPFMRQVLTKRLPPAMRAQLFANDAVTDALCFAAFGVPRSLLNMVRSLMEGAENRAELKISKSRVFSVIKECFDNSRNVFASLKTKLPLYQHFVQTGDRVFDVAIDLVKEYNSSKDVTHQSVSIAIPEPIEVGLTRVLGFLQYSGLVMPMQKVSRGEKGQFATYALHYAGLIDRNAILAQKAKNLSAMVDGLSHRSAHQFTRTNSKALLAGMTSDEAFSFALAPCRVCNAPRINETAKFCSSCGAPLRDVSIFETLGSQDISVLPLTPKRVKSIKLHSRIKLVKDILFDLEFKELRSVPQVGPVWAQRIHGYAEEFIA